jgi:hypothetical protein
MNAPSIGWKETIPDGEDEHLDALARTVHEIQKRRASEAGAAPQHAKSHTNLRATFTVRDDLAPHLRQGLFATPRTYRAYVRASNGGGTRQHDRTGDVRGLALKIVGVPGPKIIPGMEDAKTQDFLLVQAPAMPFRDAGEFVALLDALSRGQLLALPRFAARVGWKRALEILPKLDKVVRMPFTSFAGKRLYTAAPFAYGPYAVQASLIPVGDHAPSPGSIGRDGLKQDLAARAKEGPIEWDFAVQFFLDEQTTPIEDGSRRWPEERTPYVSVARLIIPRQDASTDEGRALDERIEAMSFDPWHALREHRPLGRLMRARNHAYRYSTRARGAAPEPDED